MVLIQKRAFVLVTVYSDANRSSLFEIRDIPSVTHVDMVLGAFDAVVTVEDEDEKAIEKAVTNISRTGVFIKSATPLPIGTRVNLFGLTVEEIRLCGRQRARQAPIQAHAPERYR